jgi:hypothetical protein
MQAPEFNRLGAAYQRHTMPTKRTGNPRGRPKGVKNKPKDIEAFVLYYTLDKPPRPPTPPKGPARGPWVGMTEEERKAYSQKLIAARTPGKPRKLNPELKGKPRAMTGPEYIAAKKTAIKEVNRIIKKMDKEGTLPEDGMASEALKKAAGALTLATTAKDIATLGRLVLDFTKAKPASKQEITVRSHEDFLDELAQDDPKD